MGDLGEKFYHKLLEVSSSLGMPPEQLLNVMAIESGFNPSVGSGNSAVGLVQIMPKYLSKLGFSGSASDFRRTPPEDQLIYIERLIRGNMNAFNGGRPFKNITQYYISNFLPACLLKQDVKNDEPNAILAAANPTEPHIPHSSIEYEKLVYKQNSGLDTNKDGAITYGDLTAKLSQVANGAAYRSQLSNLQRYTNYSGTIPPEYKNKSSQPDLVSHEKHYDQLLKFIQEQQTGGGDMDVLHQFNEEFGNDIPLDELPDTKPTPATNPNMPTDQVQPTAQIESLVDNLLQNVRASEKRYKRLYKTFLPTNHFVIKIEANDKTDAIEFGRILCGALEEELLATASVHVDYSNIEVQCDIRGDNELCAAVVEQLSDAVSSVFKKATAKIGGIDINTRVVINKQSSYLGITAESAIINYRKFLLKFA